MKYNPKQFIQVAMESLEPMKQSMESLPLQDHISFKLSKKIGRWPTKEELKLYIQLTVMNGDDAGTYLDRCEELQMIVRNNNAEEKRRKFARPNKLHVSGQHNSRTML